MATEVERAEALKETNKQAAIELYGSIGKSLSRFKAFFDCSNL